MTEKQFRQLKEGDVVRNKSSLDGYIVMGNFGDRVTAVRIADLTNPSEWELLMKAEHKKPDEVQT